MLGGLGFCSVVVSFFSAGLGLGLQIHQCGKLAVALEFVRVETR
jgi:hypothetical protein